MYMYFMLMLQQRKLFSLTKKLQVHVKNTIEMYKTKDFIHLWANTRYIREQTADLESQDLKPWSFPKFSMLPLLPLSRPELSIGAERHLFVGWINEVS